MARAKKKSKKKVLTPQELEQIKHIKDIRSLMANIGFARLPKVDGKQFVYAGRTTEMDDMFYCKNIIIIMEYTTGSPGHHLLNKKIVYDEINKDKTSFIEFVLKEPKFAAQAQIIKEKIISSFSLRQIQLRIVYASKQPIGKEHRDQVKNICYLDYPILKYFETISKTIKKSTIFEFADFLEIAFDQLGDNIHKNGETKDSFTAQILPEEKSSFDRGHKIITFYMDAQSLLSRAYVLRNDSWRNLEGFEHYQRLIIGKKIREMRKYLYEKRRVYVNNIIATLKSDTVEFFDEKGRGITINENGDFVDNNNTKVQQITIEIKNTSNIIGIIDGQHRIYSYHEGTDKYEDRIAKLRTIQNLLVTAILYPQNFSNDDRLKFEANLFLEINATQQNASGNIIQTIENILKPDSSTAIAKYIISKLNESGPLCGMFEQHWYETDKIKTVSVISFGLKPLIKMKGNDSLYALWDNPEKEKITHKETCTPELLRQYEDFCVEKIRDIFIGFKQNLSKDQWAMSKRNGVGVLNVTTINGIINCLRCLIQNNKVGTMETYKQSFKGIDTFYFKSYKSSQYRPMGKDIFKKFFS